MYQTVLFDLDGTISASAPGILNSVRFALSELSLEIPDNATLNSFIGPPLKTSFMRYCHLNEETAQQAVVKYRERYNTIGLFESTLYEDIVETLHILKSKGKSLIIATAKPEPLARKILAHYQLSHLFDDIVGASYDGIISTKTQVIAEVFKRNTILDPSSVVMIGDRYHDVEGAIQNGIDSIGVLYGYGDQEELENAGVTYLVEKPFQLLRIIK